MNKIANHLQKTSAVIALTVAINGCLPPSDPYPHEPADTIVSEAQMLSDSLESYIYQWTQGMVSDSIPDHRIPVGVSDSKNFYLKHPDSVSLEEIWATRFAKPINKDSLYAGIPDPNITYLLLGTALAPFGSKLIIEGEFPHSRFFSVQITPPLNGEQYYSQRQFGSAEVSVVDADIVPLPGHTNPFIVGADRNATDRSFRLEIDLTTGDPTSLNDGAHTYPYRQNTNNRKGALWVYQGPLGYKTIANTPLPAEQQGKWNLGNLWVRIYEPDANTDSLGGVALPKVYFELPGGEQYFIGSDFSALQERADETIANRNVVSQLNPNIGPDVGWFKSWSISRSILNGICISNGWSDSTARVREIDLGWTGRGATQPAPGNIEPHATTNNYISYMGRSVTVPPGMVAVLTGKLPTFPSTSNGEPYMTGGHVRYWSVCGIDQDPFSPLPSTTVHAISDKEIITDADTNYVIAYSRIADRPVNAYSNNGVSWVDWGTQSELGLLVRWLCVAPDWRFGFAPHEHNLDFAHSDWAATQYDKTLLGENWRNGFMECYLPKLHFMSKDEFEAIGASVTAENVPVWIDSGYTNTGVAESKLGSVTVSSVLDTTSVNAAENLNDGNVNTAWSSAFGQPEASATIDLGSEKVISAIKLYWDWIFFGTDYTIEVSNDNINYSTIVTATDENGAIDLYKNLQNVNGRFVKLNLTNYNAGYYRLGEFEVYTNDCECNASIVSGIGQEKAVHEMVLFPNPAMDVINVKSSLAGEQQMFIMDIQGRMVLQKTTSGNVSIMDISSLPVGTYLLMLTDQHQRLVEKFIKVH